MTEILDKNKIEDKNSFDLLSNSTFENCIQLYKSNVAITVNIATYELYVAVIPKSSCDNSLVKMGVVKKYIPFVIILQQTYHTPAFRALLFVVSMSK